MYWISEFERFTLDKTPIFVLAKFLGDFREVMIYAYGGFVVGVLDFNKTSMN